LGRPVGIRFIPVQEAIVAISGAKCKRTIFRLTLIDHWLNIISAKKTRIPADPRILRTLYILDFIDDPALRKSVQKALNRGEAYHRMRRAISYVNSGKFRVKTEGEQQIWNECSRLVANAIIFYNTALLSRVYELKLAAGDQAAIAILRGTSPVAWRNVNLIGSFDFTTAGPFVDIEALAARYDDPDFWRRSMHESDSDE